MLSGKRRIARARMPARTQGLGRGKRKKAGKGRSRDQRERKAEAAKGVGSTVLNLFDWCYPVDEGYVRMQGGAPSSEAMRDRLDRVYENYYNYNPGGDDEDAAAQPATSESVTVGNAHLCPIGCRNQLFLCMGPERQS